MFRHPDTKEFVEEVLISELKPGDDFFMYKNLRFHMYEEGAKCTSVGDTPPQDFREFEPTEKALKILKDEEVLERIGQKCPKCGHITGSAAKFCNRCRTELSPTEERDKDDFDICNEEGHLFQAAIAGARFCCDCGNEIIFI